jgi:outer membrane protein TolC
MQRTLVWLVALGAWSTAAWGQRQITEEEFLGLLGPDHPALSEARAAIGTAGAERLRRAVVEDPELGFVQEDSGDAGYERVFTLSWTAPLNGRRGPGVDAAEAGIGAAEARQRWAVLTARQAMRQAFADWVISTRRFDLLEANLDRMEGVVQSIGARAVVGEASKLAAARIELSALEVRNLLGIVEAERARALAAVQVWDDSIVEADRPIAPTLERAPIDLTLDSRADLQALSLDVERRLLEEKRSRRFVPFPELLVGWKDLEAAGSEFDGPVVGLAWDLPVGERGRPEKQEAAARREAAEGTLVFETARARAEVESASRGYAELLGAWQGSHSVVEKSAWMADAAVSRYESGEDTLTDLLDTLRSVLLAQLADTGMHARALEAHRDLELALGQPVDVGAAP